MLNRERQYGVDGPEREIYGWAAADSTAEPGQLTVHLEGTGSFGAPYWVYELGPLGAGDGLYRYSIVSDPLKATLFVLALNVSAFYARWPVAVRATLAVRGFTGFLPPPLAPVLSGCTYLLEGCGGQLERGSAPSDGSAR